MNIIGVLIGGQDLTRLLPGPPIYFLSVPPSPTGVPFRNVSISLADLLSLDVHFVGVLNDGALMHTSFMPWTPVILCIQVQSGARGRTLHIRWWADDSDDFRFLGLPSGLRESIAI